MVKVLSDVSLFLVAKSGLPCSQSGYSVVSTVGRGCSISVGSLLSCCEFKYGIVMP